MRRVVSGLALLYNVPDTHYCTIRTPPRCGQQLGTPGGATTADDERRFVRMLMFATSARTAKRYKDIYKQSKQIGPGAGRVGVWGHFELCCSFAAASLLVVARLYCSTRRG